MNNKSMNKIILFLLCLVICGVAQADTDEIFIEEVQAEPVAQQKVVENVPEVTSRRFEFNIETLMNYKYQAVAILAIFGYLIVYKIGKNANTEIVEAFYKQTHQYFYENFAHIGFTKKSGEDPFVAISPSDAMFYASGRKNIDYIEINFNMRKRQDLLYFLIYETIYPEKDLITIDIPVQTNLPIVMCVANKKKIKSLTESNIDIAKLAGSFEVKSLNSNYQVLGESAEVVDMILDNNVCRKLNQLTSLVSSIHYTDQKMFSEQTGHIRAVFNASKKNESKYLAGIQLLMGLADKMVTMKVSANYKTKAFKAREAFNASKQKQAMEKHRQELKKKKEDKLRQEQAWLRSLPPQKQKREDEKRKRKQMNKMLKSKTMKVT